MLNAEESERYSRQINLAEVGHEGQNELKNAKILMIGAGGLGCPTLLYLSGSGVGTIGIMDGDNIDLSNLHRQVLYSTQDIGQNKAATAARKLLELNPNINFNVYSEHLTAKNAATIFNEYDLIIDGSDNFETRYLVNDFCLSTNKPFIMGAIHRFEGQVSVFNYQGGPSYRCLYPEPPKPENIPNCSQLGVLNVLPGVLGTYMANECLKIILGIGNVLSGKIKIINLLDNTDRQLTIKKIEQNFTQKPQLDTVIKEISAVNLDKAFTEGKKVQLIDVREPFEADICTIQGSKLIPLNTIGENTAAIDRDMTTVVICHHGMRSAQAIHFLQSKGFSNLFNLKGGIHAWATEVDLDMERY